jgi:hypothetical protein
MKYLLMPSGKGSDILFAGFGYDEGSLVRVRGVEEANGVCARRMTFVF